MVLVFVHGWSVRNTETYGQLPQRLKKALEAEGRQVQIENIYLGKYISFDDEVTLDDIARAFDFALREKLYDAAASTWKRFACITHSTGGPVVRLWVELFYGASGLANCPMSHLLMLAPANHGSALAQLGKSRVSRLKFWAEGAEPGVKVLDWLELASEGSWDLNTKWLKYDCASAGLWVFTLTGQKIDRKLYDHLNSYTGEAGSDGVVRAAAANLNYDKVKLVQQGKALTLSEEASAFVTAFGILPGLSHSGRDMGILNSVKLTGAHPTVDWAKRCLMVDTKSAYDTLCADLDKLTAKTQADERIEVVKKKLWPDVTYETHRYSMLVFLVRNHRGAVLTDYDLLITAGPRYSPDELPKGFFVDRQRNRLNPGKLTYFLDYDVMETMKTGSAQGHIGFKIIARPDKGLAWYSLAEFRSKVGGIARLIRPNETLMVEIVLNRNVDSAVFRFTENLVAGDTGEDISATPTGNGIPLNLSSH